MQINWFRLDEKPGMASLYKTNLTLNAIASMNFKEAEYAQVGMNEDGNLVLKPITYETKEKDLMDSNGLYPIVTHPSYARISSTPLMDLVGNAIGKTLGKSPLCYGTVYDDKENCLVILIKKGEVK